MQALIQEAKVKLVSRTYWYKKPKWNKYP